MIPPFYCIVAGRHTSSQICLKVHHKDCVFSAEIQASTALDPATACLWVAVPRGDLDFEAALIWLLTTGTGT